MFSRQYPLVWRVTSLLLCILQASAQHGRYNQDGHVLDKISGLLQENNVELLEEIKAYMDIKLMGLEEIIQIHLDERMNNLEERLGVRIEQKIVALEERMKIDFEHKITTGIASIKENYQLMESKISALGNCSSQSEELTQNSQEQRIATEENSIVATSNNSTSLNRALVNTEQSSLILPTKQTPKMSWQASVDRCLNMGARPFVPRTHDDYEIIKKVHIDLDSRVWIPATDADEEGSLTWWDGEDASGSDSQGLVWWGGDYMDENSESSDCVHINTHGGSIGVWMLPCGQAHHPMVCIKQQG